MRKSVPGGMFDEDRDKIPDAPCIQGSVLLLYDLLNEVPGYMGKLFGQPVNYSGQRPHFFTNSHRASFSHQAAEVKT